MAELARTFELYFRSFPWEVLPEEAVGFDLGCGSGRWARLAAQRVGHLVCLDASMDALGVAALNAPGCLFAASAAGRLCLRTGSMDFGYSLGVLHHVPDIRLGLADSVRVLKPGAPFLVYLYYALENRPGWYRAVWRVADVMRRGISRLPVPARYAVCEVIAACVYWPLARLARLLERHGLNVEPMPLSAYRAGTFYNMRTDALDRFGTRLEKRFTKDELRSLMEAAGLEAVDVQGPPYWVAVGYKGTAPWPQA